MGRVIGKYAVGKLMQHPDWCKKAGFTMTDGMLMPYEQVIKKY